MTTASIGFRVVNPTAPYSGCLDDLADCLAEALKRTGRVVHRSDGFEFTPAELGLGPSIDVVLGAHSKAVTLPNYPVVIYQTELPSSKWWTPNYVARLESALAVWDAGHFDYELSRPKCRAVLEPGLVETTAEQVEKDIDILFYGSLSPRRIAILTKLQDAGLAPSVHFNVFGAERNRLIDRAKIVVDIKQDEFDPDDSTRTFFLDSRGACVLSENDTRADRKLDPARIVEQCRNLLSDAGTRSLITAQRRAELRPMDATRAVADFFLSEGGEPIDSRSSPRGNGVAHHQV